MAPPVAHDGYGKVARGLLRWAMWPLALLALCSIPMLVTTMGHPYGHDDRARLDLKNLNSAFEVYRRKHGSWPAETGWAQQLVDAGILAREPLDPWDHAYEFALVSTDGGELVPRLISPGRDGQAGTEDDVPAPSSR